MSPRTLSIPASYQEAAPLPLSQRSIDIWLIVWFVLFSFSTTFTDLHNFIASVRGVEVKDLEGATLAYPPKFLTDLYFQWARTVDPLLYSNPVWWCVAMASAVRVSPCRYCIAGQASHTAGSASSG